MIYAEALQGITVPGYGSYLPTPAPRRIDAQTKLVNDMLAAGTVPGSAVPGFGEVASWPALPASSSPVGRPVENLLVGGTLPEPAVPGLREDVFWSAAPSSPSLVGKPVEDMLEGRMLPDSNVPGFGDGAFWPAPSPMEQTATGIPARSTLPSPPIDRFGEMPTVAHTFPARASWGNAPVDNTPPASPTMQRGEERQAIGPVDEAARRTTSSPPPEAKKAKRSCKQPGGKTAAEKAAKQTASLPTPEANEAKRPYVRLDGKTEAEKAARHRVQQNASQNKIRRAAREARRSAQG